jgi:protease-4
MADDFNPIPRGSFDAPADAPAAPPPPPAYAAAPPPPPAYAYAPPGYGYGYPPPGYPPRKGRSGWFWFGILGGTAVLLIALFAWAVHAISKSVGSDNDASTGPAFSTSSIAVIDISGVILDAEKTDKLLRKYGDDDNVKAIVLHIDSPGGGAAASQEIYHEVMRIRAEKHKKIVASVESVGASGAYYIASACDKIYANPASVVGSIGVIMEWTNYGELMRWAKLKNITITHGELKDAGDPTRDLTPKEQAYFQSLVDNMYGQFVHDVATGRHTTDDTIRPLATGQVWTGEQAQPLGLIDAQGGFRIALMDTAKSVGINGEPKIVRPSKDRKGFFATLSDDTDTLFPNPSKLLDRAPGFYFMWK